MSTFLDTMFSKAKSDIKTIVLPEGNDIRTLEAAQNALQQNISRIIILGDEARIKESAYVLEGATIIDPKSSELRDELASNLFELRKKKGITLEDAYQLLDNELYFGVMLVKLGYADGMVSGACHSTADVLRPSLQILKTAPGVKLVSSFFIMIVPDC